MKKKPYSSKDKKSTVNDPETAYETSSEVDKWNPNKPFHGTQEEWWEHFHEIEKGEFSPAEESHQRIREWLKEQSR